MSNFHLVLLVLLRYIPNFSSMEEQNTYDFKWFTAYMEDTAAHMQLEDMVGLNHPDTPSCILLTTGNNSE